MNIEQNKQNVLKLYNKGLNSVQIAKELGFKSSTTVRRYYERLGISARNNRIVIPQDDIVLICELYSKGTTQDEIAELYPHYFKGQPSVAYFLKKQGVKIRRRGFASFVENHDFFEDIDSEEKAYYLGLLMADGAIISGQKENIISLELYGEDGYLVENFSKLVGHKKGVEIISKEQNEKKSNFATNDSTRIRFTSRKMSHDLANLGVVPRKTGKEALPPLEGDMMRHFIRGFFDGDGTVFISNRYLRFGIYSNYEMCQSILDLFGFENKVYKQKKTDICFFCIQKKSKVELFYKYIYSDATLYMKRKKQKFDDYLFNGANTERASEEDVFVEHRG